MKGIRDVLPTRRALLFLFGIPVFIAMLVIIFFRGSNSPTETVITQSPTGQVGSEPEVKPSSDKTLRDDIDKQRPRTQLGNLTLLYSPFWASEAGEPGQEWAKEIVIDHANCEPGVNTKEANADCPRIVFVDLTLDAARTKFGSDPLKVAATQLCGKGKIQKGKPFILIGDLRPQSFQCVDPEAQGFALYLPTENFMVMGYTRNPDYPLDMNELQRALNGVVFLK